MNRLLTIIIVFMQVVLYVNAQSVKSDSLFALGIDLYNAGRYNEAISVFNECDALDVVELGQECPRCYYSSVWMASCYFKQGDSIKAKSISEYYKFPLDRRLTIDADSVASLGMLLYNNGDYNAALEKFRQSAEITKKTTGILHPLYIAWYTTILNFLFVNNYNMGIYHEAIRFLDTDALQILEKIYGDEHIEDYSALLNMLANYNSEIGRLQEAILLSKKALQILEKIYSKEHPIYPMALNNLASYYSEIGDFQESIRMSKEALRLLKNDPNGGAETYAAIFFNLADCNSKMGHFNEAINLGNKALLLLAINYGKEHPEYVTILNGLAKFNFSAGNYQECFRLNKRALQICKERFGEDNPNYAKALNNLAGYYSATGNYKEATRLGTESFKLMEKIYGKEHSEYATALNNLAYHYEMNGNYYEAIRLGREAIQILEKTIGKKHPSYAMSLLNLSLYNFKISNYDEAFRMCKDALQLLQDNCGKEHPEYAVALNNLAHFHFKCGNYTEAFYYGQEALQVCKEKYGKKHSNYAVLLGNLSEYASDMGNYSDALVFGTEALKILEEATGKDNISYASILNTLSNISFKNAKYKEAIHWGIESLKIKEKNLGRNHPSYAISLQNLAWINYYIGDISSIEKYYLASYDVCYKIILNNFRNLPEHERFQLWNEYQYLATFQIFPHIFSYKYPTRDLLRCSYNASLLSKGLLLNLSRNMSEIIQTSGDQESLSLYNDLRLNRMMLQKQYERPISERILNTDSLETLTADMERELIKKSKVFGDYTKDMSIQWEDVQQRLASSDIAIEFVDFPLGTDSTMYVALTLKKGYDYPHMIPLFEKRQLKAIPKINFYTNSDLYDLVWKPLEEELTGVDTIYFSPSGELHRIAIENIPLTTTENISDRYNLQRLSSTRQLATVKDETAGENSVVYGGLKYDTTVSNATADTSFGRKRDFSYVAYANVDSLNLRESYEYLPGSKEETDSIVADLSRHSIPHTYYYDIAGTEESFKNLNGTRPRILHIATHGFYLSEEAAERKIFANLLFEDNSYAHHEDKAMTRSGLLLSGCCRALNHEKIPEGVEDGILTAEEISKLDMRGLDLVVLSACQTGLGDIISGEGVFGLQRGFKKAGAKTILMSLWKVNDFATQMLMIEFYKNYCQGIDKRESLRQAQKTVREYKDHNGKLIFEAPYYWAGFVMLD